MLKAPRLKPGKQAIVVRYDDQHAEGEVLLISPPLLSRSLKALLSIAFWVTFTFVNALTPFLHLLLVPMTIIAGVYFTALVFRGGLRVASGKAICPCCNAEFETITGKYKFPIADTCSSCGREVILALPI